VHDSSALLAQEREVLCTTLDDLARNRTPALLEALQPLASPDAQDPAQSLKQAQKVHREVQGCLANAMEQMVRLHACYHAMGVALESLSHRTRGLA
jgi:hypothetical protein